MKAFNILLTIIITILINSIALTQQWKAYSILDNATSRIVAFDTVGNPHIAAYINSSNDSSLFLLSFKNSIWKVDTLPSFGVPNGLVIDNNNTIWVSTGVKLFKIQNSTISNESALLDSLPGGIGNGTIGRFTLGANNIIWAAYREYSNQKNYIVAFDGINWTIFDSTATGIPNANNSIPSKILYDKINDKLYITTFIPDGIFIYHNNFWTKVDTLNSNLSTGIMEDLEVDSKGDLWGLLHHQQTGAILKLWKYDGNSFIDYNAPATNLQRYFEIDSNDNIWFNTWGDSIIKFDGNSWSNFHLPINMGSIPHTIGEQSFKINKNNSIWIAGVWSSSPSIVEFNESGNFTNIFQYENPKQLFKVYPNPFTNSINISNPEKIQNVELFDLSGKSILVKHENFTQFNLSYVNSGAYILKIVTKENNIEYLRLVKE